MYKTFIVYLVAFMLLVSGCNSGSVEIISDNSLPSVSALSSAEPDEKIGVYVCGEVMSPGMYYFTSDSRVKDALEAAGGITSYGVIDYLNLADYLKDCDKIYVPSQEDLASGSLETGGEAISDDRININSASKDELMELPGIGESKAQSIIDYREEHGAYNSIEDILNISGIKDGVFQKIKELIKV